MACMLQENLIYDMLRSVRRPGRYFGGEVNFPQRRDGDLRFLLCFPDLYDIGMSNMGLRVLYHVLNREPDVMADLTFAPWVDMEAFMRERRVPLCGIGTGIRAGEFDILGFSLQHELQYANVLNMLDLAGVPMRSAERGDGDPVVIAGGPCAFNPAPMSEFIDGFALGDGESVSREVAACVLAAKTRGLPRSRMLERLAEVDGVYVPPVHGTPAGFPHAAAPLSIESMPRISRRTEPELNEEDFPLPPIVPLIPITHDRLSLEIMRGCTRGCRFCSAGMLTRPVRQRKIDSVVRLAEAGIKQSGWEEVSLVSLSTSDYYDLEGLARSLANTLAPHHVSISLPSMRPGTFSPELARIVGQARKTGLTFAPEAGSEGLRRSINKDVSEDQLYQTIETAFSHGWDSVKLYFMVGLPNETDEDIEALIKMVRSVESVCRGYGKRRKITLSLSPFVPRPHTPFQWEAQAEPDVLLRRTSMIRKRFPDKRVKLKWRDPYMAKLEGLLARGDSGVSSVIFDAWKAGARFDSWTDQFNFDVWMRCFEDSGIDTARQFKKREVGEPLPWGFLDGGVSASFLAEEARKAEGGELTPDCRTAECTSCGACPGKTEPAPGEYGLTARPPSEGDRPIQTIGRPRQHREVNGRIRYRVKYVKTEDMRFTSHLDVVRSVQRGLRRAELPVCFSTGFSPHPRISFGPPLPLGVTSDDEYVDVLFSRQPGAGWLDRLNECLPAGLKALEARLAGLKGPSLMKYIDVASYMVEVSEGPEADRTKADGQGARGVAACAPSAGAEPPALADGTLAPRIKDTLSSDERVLSVDLSRDGDRIMVSMSVRLTKGSVRPDKLLETVIEGTKAYIKTRRTGLYHDREGRLCPPFEVEAGERLSK